MSIGDNHKRIITALVEDKPGVLNRVSSMFRRRGFNIYSLAVGRSELPELSRMTFVVDGNDAIVEQVTKHLNKLIDVIKVSDISDEKVVNRELALIRVNASTSNRSEIIQIVDIFRAKIIDVGSDSLIIEVTGDESKIDSLQKLLSNFGITEIMRTGTIAMTRGSSEI
ncbi:MAG: acetolactate synthase small subunit [Chloroflexi bacterium]|jgi:acetolactate synthase-1/3 small subunit|nr:acetolactate synthase small subunit [Chloroflexota bacterium]|tara:strand:+ start:145 stop:648 length:504 start_codon:yes stop_codon:yes gene_type:complete